ncbi:hypothetical protein TREES_T100003387 [Tupaia chinensis]|uniref:Uncharacterized protein n=1 Tax=Tupaia chinensis TaxID=246437 RepID=L9JBP0_TUPCH|nr:hypothetical protein TREES_T100003387 [Tupaia chinensis]
MSYPGPIPEHQCSNSGRGGPCNQQLCAGAGGEAQDRYLRDRGRRDAASKGPSRSTNAATVVVVALVTNSYVRVQAARPRTGTYVTVGGGTQRQSHLTFYELS